MRVLYHLTLSPFARKVRLVLAEKNLDFTLKLEKVWERRAEFLALNPAGDVPVLIEPDGTVLAATDAIVEYLDEVYREKILIGINPVDRAEVRRLCAWFDTKMNLEVTENLLGEKMMRRFQGFSQPNSQAIRAGHANLPAHLDYIGYLVERRGAPPTREAPPQRRGRSLPPTPSPPPPRAAPPKTPPPFSFSPLFPGGPGAPF